MTRGSPRAVEPHSSVDADFIKIDLHIHTPASHCYKGPRNEQEYLRILGKAKSAGLKIIAITDHNTIQGYEKMVQIRSDLLAEKKALSSITDSRQTRSRLVSIEKTLSLYDDILILPGVEFEVNNGIHLLVIFSDSVTPATVQKFIVDGGYNSNAFGKEDPPVLANWDIFALFEQSKKHDCIVIDAHTDSNKGIYNTIPKGATRANCFKSSQLCAICYNNEAQKEQLKSTLQTAQEYRRTTPVSFVKFSDAHCADDVGRPLTWVKLAKITFAALRGVFSNSSELVSTERPSVDIILTRLLKEGTTLRVPDLNPENCQLLTRMVCALHNSGGGHVLVGVNEHGNRLGVPHRGATQKERVRALLQQIYECLKSINGRLNPRTSIEFYPLQNDRAIVSIYLPGSDDLISSGNDNLVYYLKDNNLVVLSATEIQSLVEQRTAHEIETKVGDKITAIEKDCRLVRSFFASLPIVSKFEKNTLATVLRAEVEESIALDAEQMARLQRFPANGKSRGNTAYFNTTPQSPRLPSAYLRYSTPLMTASGTASTPEKKETLYVVPGGGVYYSARDCRFYADSHPQILKLHPNNSNAPYGMKFTACFLKSSFFLWYCLASFGDVNIWNPRVFNNIRLPLLDAEKEETKQQLRAVEGNLRAILALERAFLTGYSSISSKDTNQFVEAHNGRVAPFAYEIDRAIYSLLSLSSDEVLTIEASLRLSDVSLPSATESEEPAL
jgi:hypothetical protein